MKKLILLAVCFTSISFAAVNFSYEGFDHQLFDETGTNRITGSPGVPVAGYTGVVFLDTDISSLVSGLTIDIADLSSPFTSLDVFLPFGNILTTSSYSDPTSGDAGAGQTPYLIIHQGNGTISVGDYIGIVGFPAGHNPPTTEIEITGTGSTTPGTPQTFGLPSSGTPTIITTNVQVIPEPTTFLLLAMAGLRLVATRKLKK